MKGYENPSSEGEHTQKSGRCTGSETQFASFEELDIDISDILRPEESSGVCEQSLEIRPDSQKTMINNSEAQDFLYFHSKQRPLVNNQLEFYSSSVERIKLTHPRLPDLVAKKTAQKRMRIIILFDIVLFIVILGVVYPSLRNLQSNGRLGDYRFSLSLNLDAEQGLLNIVTKAEKLADNKQKLADRYQIQVTIAGQDLLNDSRSLPDMSSPVSYAMFSAPYKDLPDTLLNNTSEVYINIKMGNLQKEFYLFLPKIEP